MINHAMQRIRALEDRIERLEAQVHQPLKEPSPAAAEKRSGAKPRKKTGPSRRG